MGIKEEIQEYFGPALNPVKLLLLESKASSGEFKSLFSTINGSKNENFLLYDLPALMRLLCQRRGVLKKELLDQFDPKSELCLIVDWLENQKRVVIIDLEDEVTIEREKLKTLVDGAREKWNRWFLMASEKNP